MKITPPKSASRVKPISRRKRRGKFAALAPASGPRRRLVGGEKRSFRFFSAADPFSAKDSDGADVDHSPFELSSRAVKLSALTDTLGMDANRKKNQQRLLWYWQWSRDWQVNKKWSRRQIEYALNADTEHSEPLKPLDDDAEQQRKKKGVWFWRWQERTGKKRRNTKDGKSKRFRGQSMLSGDSQDEHSLRLQ